MLNLENIIPLTIHSDTSIFTNKICKSVSNLGSFTPNLNYILLMNFFAISLHISVHVSETDTFRSDERY